MESLNQTTKFQDSQNPMHCRRQSDRRVHYYSMCKYMVWALRTVLCSTIKINSLTKDNYVRFVQIQSNCRRQIRLCLNGDFCDRVENIFEKGENAGDQHFLLFLTVFSEVFSFRVLKRLDFVPKD